MNAQVKSVTIIDLFIINSLMSQNRQKSIKQFFQSVNSLDQSEVQLPFVTLSTFLVGKDFHERQNKLVLKDNLLLFAVKQHEEYYFTHGLMLSEGITFKRIVGECGSGKDVEQLKGFRLIDTEGHYVNFFLPFQTLTRIWLQKLARIINQIGFCEQYEILGKLGRGSTANVYEVRRKYDHQMFAAKVVLKGYLKQKEEREKALAQEIQMLRVLEHQNVIKLQGVFESQQAVYMIFQRISGGNLLEYINVHRGLTIPEIKTVMRGIAEGLAYLHRFNIAHRDIKLENILLRKGDTLQPVIADFGLAIFVEEEPYLFYRCGTPGYVAPEIIRMKENKGIKVGCDIFSAGVILHILLTNSYLFAANTNDEVYRLNNQAKHQLSGEKYHHLDPQALDLLKKMLTLRVSDRLTAQEMLQEPFLLPENQESNDEKPILSPATTQAGESCAL